MARKLTRPRRLDYNCSEAFYELFLKQRDELGLTTGEMFDRLMDIGDSNYKLVSRIKQLTAERDQAIEFNQRLLEAQGG